MKALPSDQARRLAFELLEKHGQVEGRRVFLRAVGLPPYSTALGAAEAVSIWNEAVPKPPPAAKRPWYPPAVQDPTGRDRWQIVRSLVEHGVRPDSLADCTLQLIEHGWTKERALRWAELQGQAGSRYTEPWLAEAKKILARN